MSLTQALVIFGREYADGNVGLWSQAELISKAAQVSFWPYADLQDSVEFQSLRDSVSPVNLLI